MNARCLLDDLRLLLNTRIGECPAAPDYGVPDLADLLHQFPSASPAFQQAIRAALARHAPHLRGLTIRPSPPAALIINATCDGAPLQLRVTLAHGRCDLS